MLLEGVGVLVVQVLSKGGRLGVPVESPDERGEALSIQLGT